MAVTQPQADDDGATPPEAQPARSPSSASEAPEAGSRALAEEVDDENANWRFLTSEDEIRAADVPEEMRIRIAHDEPNLFTAVACDPDETAAEEREPVNRIDIWATDREHPDGPVEFLPFPLAKEFLGVWRRDGSYVNQRRLGETWNAIVEAMPWFAAVDAGRDTGPSARVRLIEMALRTLVVLDTRDGAADVVLDPLAPHAPWTERPGIGVARGEHDPDTPAAVTAARRRFTTTADEDASKKSTMTAKAREIWHAGEQQIAFQTSVAMMMYRGWQRHRRNAITYGAPGAGPIYFASGEISDELRAVPELAARLTTCVANPQEEEALRLAVSRAFRAISQLSGEMAGEPPPDAAAADVALDWTDVAEILARMNPDDAGGDQLERNEYAWLGRPTEIAIAESRVNGRAAEICNEMQRRHQQGCGTHPKNPPITPRERWPIAGGNRCFDIGPATRPEGAASGRQRCNTPVPLHEDRARAGAPGWAAERLHDAGRRGVRLVCDAPPPPEGTRTGSGNTSLGCREPDPIRRRAYLSPTHAEPQRAGTRRHKAGRLRPRKRRGTRLGWRRRRRRAAASPESSLSRRARAEAPLRRERGRARACSAWRSWPATGDSRQAGAGSHRRRCARGSR